MMVWKQLLRRGKLSAAGLALVALAVLPSYGNAAAPGSNKQKSYVYVCACMGTSSCSCMSEAKHEGPCACGTKGGPPMQRVDANSNWAKYNRQQLAK
jgi:hypothetical protein